MITENQKKVISEVQENIFAMQRELEALVLMNEYGLEFLMNFPCGGISEKGKKIVENNEITYEFTAKNLSRIVESLKENYDLLDI